MVDLVVQILMVPDLVWVMVILHQFHHHKEILVEARLPLEVLVAEEEQEPQVRILQTTIMLVLVVLVLYSHKFHHLMEHQDHLQEDGLLVVEEEVHLEPVPERVVLVAVVLVMLVMVQELPEQ